MKDNGFILFVLVLALLYIISPVDLLPELLLGPVGLADDVAVGIGAGAACLKS